MDSIYIFILCNNKLNTNKLPNELVEIIVNKMKRKLNNLQIVPYWKNNITIIYVPVSPLYALYILKNSTYVFI